METLNYSPFLKKIILTISLFLPLYSYSQSLQGFISLLDISLAFQSAAIHLILSFIMGRGTPLAFAMSSLFVIFVCSLNGYHFIYFDRREWIWEAEALIFACVAFWEY